MFWLSCKRFFLLLILVHLLVGCNVSEFKKSFHEFKDNSMEMIKVSLSDLPIVGGFIKLHPRPEALYREVERSLESIKAKGAEKHLPDEYAVLNKRWHEAKNLYDRRLYLQAEKRLKALAKDTREMEGKLNQILTDLQKEALRKYEERRRELLGRLENLKEDERVKVRLYLLYLRTLVEQGRFKEFEQELLKDPLG